MIELGPGTGGTTRAILAAMPERATLLAIELDPMFADHVRTIGGRMDFEGHEIRPFDVDTALAAARWFRERGITTIGAGAVHAGLLKSGGTDLLRVTVVTPPEKFPGTVRNGVTSTEYGRYQYAWKLSAV